MEHVAGRHVHLRPVAFVGQEHDAGIGRGVDVVAALLDEPQVKREPELVALDIHEAVARQRAVQFHEVPQVGSRHDWVCFLLQQIVNALAKSAHILYEVAALEVLFAVLHRHHAHRVATQRHGTIDRRNGASRLWASRRHDALHVVAALHLWRFWWHSAQWHSWSGCLALSIAEKICKNIVHNYLLLLFVRFVVSGLLNKSS